MSVMTELFANPATTATTVSSGGTTAPAAGTPESWTVAGGFAQFPAASSAARPPSFFRIFDPANASEVMFVTNVSGSTWTVTRGAEGTTPVAHAAGFTVEEVISAGTLANFVQGPGDGLSVPGAGVVMQTAVSNSTATITVAQLTIPANEPVAGSVYEIEIFGVYSTAATAPSLVFSVAWGATTTGSQALGTGASAAAARFRAHAIIVFNSATQYTINVKVDVATTNTGATSVPGFMFGPTANNTVTTSSAQVLKMTMAWGTASVSNSFTVYGGKIWKSA